MQCLFPHCRVGTKLDFILTWSATFVHFVVDAFIYPILSFNNWSNYNITYVIGSSDAQILGHHAGLEMSNHRGTFNGLQPGTWTWTLLHGVTLPTFSSSLSYWPILWLKVEKLELINATFFMTYKLILKAFSSSVHSVQSFNILIYVCSPIKFILSSCKVIKKNCHCKTMSPYYQWDCGILIHCRILKCCDTMYFRYTLKFQIDMLYLSCAWFYTVDIRDLLGGL